MSVLVEFVVIISFVRLRIIYFAVGLMEFSCGKWRPEVCHRFLVFSSLVCLPVQLNCFAFVFVSSLIQCCAQLSSSSCSVIPIPCSVNFSFVFFFFVFVFFFFGFDFASHIFTTRPQTISWLDSH